ncbi:MAG: hypothetical protein K2X81_12050 [Candidatus Obscuribacterales bacterium]|nr:hypothetical protein [Candidatus Obscuribacterales bacterium]
MTMTLTDISKLSEAEIASMLELDPAKSLEFVKAKIAEFETERKISTNDMLRLYKPDSGKVESWIQEWHDLFVMQRDLTEENACSQV